MPSEAAQDASIAPASSSAPSNAAMAEQLGPAPEADALEGPLALAAASGGHSVAPPDDHDPGDDRLRRAAGETLDEFLAQLTGSGHEAADLRPPPLMEAHCQGPSSGEVAWQRLEEAQAREKFHRKDQAQTTPEERGAIFRGMLGFTSFGQGGVRPGGRIDYHEDSTYIPVDLDTATMHRTGGGTGRHSDKAQAVYGANKATLCPDGDRLEATRSHAGRHRTDPHRAAQHAASRMLGAVGRRFARPFRPGITTVQAGGPTHEDPASTASSSSDPVVPLLSPDSGPELAPESAPPRAASTGAESLGSTVDPDSSADKGKGPAAEAAAAALQYMREEVASGRPWWEDPEAEYLPGEHEAGAPVAGPDPEPQLQPEDVELAYLEAQAARGAERVAWGYASLKELVVHLDGEAEKVTKLRDRLDAQLAFLRVRTADRTRRDDKACARWEAVASSANRVLQPGDQPVEGLDMARAARERMQDRLDEIARERAHVVGIRERALALKKLRKAGGGLVDPRLHRDVGYAADAMASLGRLHVEAGSLSGQAVGSQAEGVKVGAGPSLDAAMVGAPPAMHTGVGASLTGRAGHGRSVQDDRMLRDAHSAGAGLGGNATFLGRFGVNLAGGVDYSRAQVYAGAEHMAARKATNPEARGALSRLAHHTGEGGYRDVAREGSKAPTHVRTTKVHGSVGGNLLAQGFVEGEDDEAYPDSTSADTSRGVRAEAGGSRARVHFRKRDEDGRRLHRTAHAQDAHLRFAIGGLSAKVTLSQVDGHAIADNDGTYFNARLGLDERFLGVSGLDQHIDSFGDSLAGELDDWSASHDGALSKLKVFVERALNGLRAALRIEPSGGQVTDAYEIHLIGNHAPAHVMAWAKQYAQRTLNFGDGMGFENTGLPTLPAQATLGGSVASSRVTGLRMGTQTLTYAQTVHGGYMKRNRGQEAWDEFKQLHSAAFKAMIENAGTAGSKLDRELGGVDAELGRKLDEIRDLRTPVEVEEMCGQLEPKLDSARQALAALRRAATRVSDGSDEWQTTLPQLDAYLDAMRAVSAAEQAAYPVLDRAANQGSTAASTFLRRYFGGQGTGHGWVFVPWYRRLI